MKFDNLKKEITAPVLVPEQVDYDGHIYSEEEVLKACRNYTDNCNKMSLQHKFPLGDDTVEFVEHYVTPADMTIGEELVKKGTWLATMRIKDDNLWKAVEDKQFTGFSIQATATTTKVSKAKVVGSDAELEGVKVEKRLSNIDFSKEDHHIALVDEGANATKILVVKAREVETETDKDIQMSEELKQQLEESKTQLEAVSKSKVELEAQVEELKKAKEDKDNLVVELENLKKEKKEQELKELVTKSKELKADTAESFAVVLQKCKSALSNEEYVELVKQLDKLPKIIESKEYLNDIGEGSSAEENLVKSKDKKFTELREKYISEGCSPAEASRKARLEVK